MTNFTPQQVLRMSDKTWNRVMSLKPTDRKWSVLPDSFRDEFALYQGETIVFIGKSKEDLEKLAEVLNSMPSVVVFRGNEIQ